MAVDRDWIDHYNQHTGWEHQSGPLPRILPYPPVPYAGSCSEAQLAYEEACERVEVECDVIERRNRWGKYSRRNRFKAWMSRMLGFGHGDATR